MADHILTSMKFSLERNKGNTVSNMEWSYLYAMNIMKETIAHTGIERLTLNIRRWLKQSGKAFMDQEKILEKFLANHIYKRKAMERQDYQFGDYVVVEGDITVEQAREKLVDAMCNELRRIAKEEPEQLFIEKKTFGFHTVGYKLMIPR